MEKIRLEDIVFWILIASIIGVAIWLLSGSPTDTSAIVSISVFVAASEVLIWKYLFNIDKRTAVGFEKIKSDMNSKLSQVNTELKEIKTLIKKK